jgi:hypothetical protein
MDERARCTARSQQTGERCRRARKPGWRVCHYHGAGGGSAPGNQKAFRNGLKSAATLARRAEVNAVLRQARAVLREAD